MKAKFVVLVLLSLLLLTVFIVPVEAQSTPNMNDIRYITEGFFNALAKKNIAVATSFQCGSNYRKDWAVGTYMALTGKGFPWTDQYGNVHLHMFTMQPPMSLEGYRPPMTLTTADVDVDGNITVGDPGYWIRYRIWQTRPCLDFTTMLRDNPGLASAWNYWINHYPAGEVAKFQKHWEALGLSKDGRVTSFIDPKEFQDDAPDLTTMSYSLQWEDIPSLHYEGEEYIVDDTPVKFFGLDFWVIAAIAVCILLMSVVAVVA